MRVVIDIPDDAYKILLTEQRLPKLDMEYLIMHGTPVELISAPIAPLTPEDDVHYEWVYIKSRIERSQTIIKQLQQGTWLDKKITIKKAHGIAYGRWSCSVCKAKQPHKSSFCPNCGADMRQST